MNRALAGLFIAAVILAGATGCRPPTRREGRPGPGTEAAPDPWADVKVSILFEVANRQVKITVVVEDYPTSPEDYVRRFELVDDRQIVVGQRVFAYGDEPRETFILDPASKDVTVTVTATGRGSWQSEPRPLPPIE